MKNRAGWMLTCAAAGALAATILGCSGESNASEGGSGGAISTPTPASATERPDSDASTPVVSTPSGGSAGGAGPGGDVPAVDEPPSTVVSANGVSVEAGIGTYCWTRMCVDKIGVPTEGTLVVSPGDVVTINVPPGAPTLREAVANAFPATTPMPLDDGSEIWPYPGLLGETIPHALTSEGVEVTIALAPGRYVLGTSLFFESGDVIYGVLLDVR